MSSASAARRGFDWRGLVLPVGLVLAWLVAAHVYGGTGKGQLLVPVESVVTAPFTDVDGQAIWLALVRSALRLATGFLIGGAAGIALGLLRGMSRLADRSVGPTFNAVRQVTLFAWIPLLTAWFGNGEGAKLVFIAMATFFPVVLNTQEGLRSVPVPLTEAAKVFRLSRASRIRKLLLPGALPSIATGLQLGLITAWLSTIGAEYAMGYGTGIGTFLVRGRELFRMDLVALAVIVLGVFGWLLNYAATHIFRRLLHWQGNIR